MSDLLTEIDFAPLYTNHGRAAISPALLALVTIFQFLEDVLDRQAAELVRVRLDWKYALHLPVRDLGFDFGCLCYFRRRLLAHQQEQTPFDPVLARIRSLGLIKLRGKQRTDSIAVVGAVRELSRLELVSETVRLALRSVEQTAPLWAQRQLPASLREQYGRRVQDYRLSAAERQAALLQTGQDGAWLLQQLRTAPSEVAAAEAVGMLRQMWEQQYSQQEGAVSVRADTVDCTELIVTPHDPGVRAGQKRGHRWRGEKAHVTETAEPDRPNFITDVTTTGASEIDSGALATVRTRERGQGLLPSEQHVDAGYVTGRERAESAAEGIALLGPALPDTSPNTFKIADFPLDWEAQEARCPAGQTSVQWRPKTERDGSTAVQIQFAAATCAACPLKPQCTAGASGRSLHINEHHDLVAARRAEAQTETFRHKLNARAAIEATLSELVRAHGFRRHRYRGERKRHAEHLWKAAACNLKRLVWVLRGQTAPSFACLVAPYLPSGFGATRKAAGYYAPVSGVGLPGVTGCGAASPIGTTGLPTAFNAAGVGLTGIVTLPNVTSAATTVQIGASNAVHIAGASPIAPLVLSRGCNSVVVTSAAGTPVASIAALVSPTSAAVSIWRFDNGAKLFRAGWFADRSALVDFAVTGGAGVLPAGAGGMVTETYYICVSQGATLA